LEAWTDEENCTGGKEGRWDHHGCGRWQLRSDESGMLWCPGCVPADTSVVSSRLLSHQHTAP
jgi:hypothetical protein